MCGLDKGCYWKFCIAHKKWLTLVQRPFAPERAAYCYWGITVLLVRDWHCFCQTIFTCCCGGICRQILIEESAMVKEGMSRLQQRSWCLLFKTAGRAEDQEMYSERPCAGYVQHNSFPPDSSTSSPTTLERPLVVWDEGGNSAIRMAWNETSAALYNGCGHFAVCKLSTRGCDHEEVAGSTSSECSWYFHQDGLSGVL